MSDPCDRLETLPVGVWSKTTCRDGQCKRMPGAGRPAPPWMEKLVDEIAAGEGLKWIRPVVAVMAPKCSSNFGGRWFPQLNGIGVFEHAQQKYVFGVTVHEMGHWLRWAQGGDEPGEHDQAFYTLMQRLYPKFGVTVKTALSIEAVPPPSWTRPGAKW